MIDINPLSAQLWSRDALVGAQNLPKGTMTGQQTNVRTNFDPAIEKTYLSA